MLMQILYPYLKFVFGTLYPAYKTWKALKRKDETTRRRWMKYWVSFGAFQLFEFVADITLAFILPLYIELKLFSILWLVVGTKLVFDSIVNRELTKWEKTIDRALTKTKKARDEVVAVVWHEVSRCSIQILSSVVSAVLVNTSGKLTSLPEAVTETPAPAPKQESVVEVEEMETEEDEGCVDTRC